MSVGETRAQQPTLEMVAARAGVGRGTASRVINGSPQVSERTREIVMQAVEELGYVPNQAARTLVTRRTDTVALVIAESEERIFGEPFFAGVVRGISSALNDASRQLVLSLVHSTDQAERLGAYLTRQHVDGVLLLSLHDDEAFPVDLAARGLPVVVGGRSAQWAGSFVDVDNVAGARQAVAHLADTGRRTIATVSGPRAMASGRDRLDGYAEALRAAGLAYDEELVVEGDFSEQSGWAGMQELLARRPDIDGVFAASDLMAMGALRSLRAHGRRVPEDVGVIGFDGTPSSETSDPPLSTVRQPLTGLGRAMAEMLLRHVDADEQSPEQLVLPVELIVRASTARTTP
ncbi:LacI family DNA-binding transcriptional regulator [Aeromicrobium sp. SMF47]|uniref:LacI family DNA-binding transcriptional regulator n=1 Tax=Aeromicrobium yanjiei TaxID=2662028 RepID=A0A5Q2MP86_9ACTN|nr:MULTISPECIES: LacI family DNA-binding transcriptional regulator [Aeromicrobium]MRJ76981.1 LacI family DNA-binding transcriptional regulator [Aeromicrobium yanjiei]MRK01325.1 LacI family DNA-binding transcriptional regulator [Aeromicrobium sp. S22]QGG41900.1 LacI family DNA-binding transcriptional regulator [Aeromicrobium yanjiei]